MKLSAKNFVALSICLFALLMLSACTEKADTTEKSRAQEIDEQLQGTWVDESDNGTTMIWTFYNGRYVMDFYKNGVRCDFHIAGFYAIGQETIETINDVKGAIPYSFEDGELILGEGMYRGNL